MSLLKGIFQEGKNTKVCQMCADKLLKKAIWPLNSQSLQ